MAEPDLYELFAAEQEPDARAQAAALAAVLRGQRQQAGQKRAAGNLGLLTGDRVLSGFGQAQLQQASQSDALAQNREGLIPDAAKFRLTKAMQQRQFDADQAHRGANLELERENLGLRRQALEQTGKKAEKDAKGDVAKLEEGLRKELMNNPVTRAAQDVAVAYDKMQRAAKAPTAAGDLSLIFAYMKMLDPGSTVREGEFANAQNATGIPGRVVNMYNNALKGERLDPTQRADFLGQAQGLYEAQLSRYKPLADQYASLAQRVGVDPTSVVLDLGFGTSSKAQPTGGDLDLEAGGLPADKAKRLKELREKREAGVLR